MFANVSPLGAGGDFETQIDHGNSKPDRTTRRIFTVKPRLRQTAVMHSISHSNFFSMRLRSEAKPLQIWSVIKL